MKNKFWTMTAKAGGELEILLYEMIGQDFWTGEGTTAKSFAEDLKAAGDGIRKIHLRVNSPGGNVFDGLAIFNTLLSHGAKVTAAVDGIAASIASVIVMAASEISMNDNAMMMIHNPAAMIGGDSNAMRKMAETLDKVKASMTTAYRRHTDLSVTEIGALMDAETWMTAQETVDNGFAETVTPEEDARDVAANFGQVFAKFRNVPRQIAARCASGGDDSERRRASRLREQTLEMHEMQEADSRAGTLATRAQQLSDMRAAPEPSEDLQHRRTLARMERELQAMRLADLAKLGRGSVEAGRRAIEAEHAKEVADYAPATLNGHLFVPINRFVDTRVGMHQRAEK